MNLCTPERAGISSARVAAFVKRLEEHHLSTHSILMARLPLFFELSVKPTVFTQS